MPLTKRARPGIGLAGVMALALASGCTTMHQAAQTGNLQALVKGLDAGKDVNAVDGRGRPLLISAAERGQLQVVQTLLARGADLEKTDDRGMTALYVAAAANQLPVVQELVGAGADLESRNTEQALTPLMPAVEQGYKAVADYLLARGARADVASADGQTALARLLRLNPQSSQSDIAGTAQLLLSTLHGRAGKKAAGDYLNQADSSGYTALHRAVLNNNSALVSLLLQQGASTTPVARLPDQTRPVQPPVFEQGSASGLGALWQAAQANLMSLTAGRRTEAEATTAPAAEPEIDQWSMLHSAARHCAAGSNVFQSLLAASPQPGVRSSDGRSVLHLLLACEQDMAAETGQLLARVKARGTAAEQRQYANLPDPAAGEPPLSLAVSRGKPALLPLLLAAGAQPDLAGSSEVRPLLAAIRAGRAGMVKTLLAAKASPDKADAQGATPLQVAATLGNVEITEALLAARANPNALSARGESALHLALAGDHLEVARRLLAAKASPDQPLPAGGTLLLQAVDADRRDKVQLLLAHGANPNRSSGDEAPALMRAVQAGQPELVALLLAARADASRLHQGLSPLQVAVRKNRADLARQLLAAGADINAQAGTVTGRGDTALHHAAREGQNELYELLLASGASSTLRNGEGKTALELRAERIALERKRFLDGLEKAGVCAGSNDFACAGRELAQSKTLIRDAQQEQLWAQTQAGVQQARQRWEELRAAEEAERRRQEAEEKRQADEAKARAFMAIAGTAYIAANSKQIGADNASRMIDSWNRDVLSGDMSFSSTKALQQTIQQENQQRQAEMMRRLAAQREREREQEAARRAQLEAEAQALRARQAQQAAENRQAQERQLAAANTAAEQARRAEEQRQAEQRRREQERQRAEQERLAAEQAAAREAERKRQAAEAEAERQRQTEQRRLAEEQLKRDRQQAYQDWLNTRKSGTRLGAKSCDGKEKPYRLIGQVPTVPLPRSISYYSECITVHYEARCPSTPRGRGIRGRQYNFTGGGVGCLSAESMMPERLACADTEVIVETVDVTSCGG